MKSIERRFKTMREENPYWSDYVTFSRTIAEQEFSEKSIREWFRKLVPLDDYTRSEREDIVQHLLTITRKRHEEENDPL